MNEFITYIELGLLHVLDINGYDHILFITVLAVIYLFEQWKKVIWLVTLFTIGHTITLTLSAYGILEIDVSLVEFLIPTTIFVTALSNILISRKTTIRKENQNLLFALTFGLIHGLGFSNYFKMLVSRNESKLLPLLEFTLGVELAQIIVVIIVLLITTLLKSYRRYWIISISAIVLGLSAQMMYLRWPW